MDMKKKIGPLPVWAWGLIIGVAAYFLYERYSAGSSSASGSTSAGTTGILDPNAVDPNTGLTYGEEEAAALNGSASTDASGGGSGGGGVTGPTDSGLTSDNVGTGTDEFGDLLGAIQEFEAVGQALGWTAPGMANMPAPVAGSSPPNAPAAANTNSLIQTHPGGPFYDWYVKTYGSAPPSSISALNARYLAWKSGTPAVTAKTIPVGSQAGQAGTAVLNNSSSLGKAASITTHPGGTFYTWYTKAFGSPPPATLSATNARYVAWTKGVPAAQAKKIPA